MSIVLPVFNEAGTLRGFFRELVAVVEPLGFDIEVVFINDGSSDGSLEVMRDIKKEYLGRAEVLILDLARNFGHQAAVTAGIEHTTGDAVLIMDTDMQDDPRSIPAMIDKWKGGAEVIYATRTSRREPAPVRFLFNTYYRIFSSITPIEIPHSAGNFGLIDRRVVEEIRCLPEHNRYYPGLRAWVGFRQDGVDSPRRERSGGKSRVGLMGLASLAFDAFFGFSALPLRLAFAAAVLLALTGMAGIAVIFYIKLFTDLAVPMWSSIMTVVIFTASIQFFLIGLLGEYIARIYTEVKNRPHYIVRDRY
ncbi:MAG: glycosyltransferase family 2 protein [Acidobacteria bacterium]|jgi:glycosyltransferase involved in cell wall biosynthesis|nr:glycosyltransferase family 2 protein [Acidobacteriota bacterium]